MKVGSGSKHYQAYIGVPNEPPANNVYFKSLNLEEELEVAAKRNDFESVQVFVGCGADLTKFTERFPPVFWSIHNRNYEMTTFLLRKMNLKQMNKFYNELDCNLLIFSIFHRDVLAIEILMDANVFVGTKDSSGHDAVHYAMLSGDTDILKTMGLKKDCCSIL
jgi:hypothetical protein